MPVPTTQLIVTLKHDYDATTDQLMATADILLRIGATDAQASLEDPGVENMSEEHAQACKLASNLEWKVEALEPKLIALQEKAAKLDRIATAQGTFRPTGNPDLDRLLTRPSADFEALRDSLPDTYWARYDLSAVRLGYELAIARGQATGNTAQSAPEDDEPNDGPGM